MAAEERTEIDPLDEPLTRRDFLRALHELGDAFKAHTGELPDIDVLHGTAYDTAAERLGEVWSRGGRPRVAEMGQATGKTVWRAIAERPRQL